MTIRPALTLLRLIAPLLAGADTLDVYGNLTGMTVVMPSALHPIGPAGLNAAKAQPFSLPREKTGQSIPIPDGELTCSLLAYAPASFILQ